MKRFLFVLVLAAIVASLGFAGARRQPVDGERFALLLKPLSNEYWATMKEGVQAWARQNNVIVNVYAVDSEENFTGQLNQLENLVRLGYSGIGVAPLSPVNLINGIVMANRAGIPVANVDEPVDFAQLRAAGGHMIVNYTTDNIAVGRTGGNYIVQRIGAGAQAAIIEGTAGNVTSRLRSQGAQEAMRAGGVNVVSIQNGDWDRVRALDIATNIMQAHPNVRAFYAANDTMALGILQAVINMGRTDTVIVVGTDAVPGAVESVQAGGLAATVGQDPVGIGIASVQALIRAHREGFVFDPSQDIPVRYIDSFLVTR